MSEDLVVKDGLAIDFGGTKTSAARIADGHVLHHVENETDGNASVDHQIATMSNLLRDLDLTATDEISVAVTGRVDNEGNWFALNRDTLKAVQSVPLKAKLGEVFQRDVHVINDAIAAAIGEWIIGAGKNCRSLGYITVSTGVGGGFIANGRPLMSPSGFAGHIGFTSSRHADTACGSGRFGTVESVASGRAIARIAAERGHDAKNARAVYEAHLAGAIWATEIVDLSARAVAELCANIKAILDPEIIVLGGGIGLADGYLALVEHHLNVEPELFRAVLKRSALGTHAALLGARAG